MKGARLKKKRLRNADVKENNDNAFIKEKKKHKESWPTRNLSYSNVFLKKTFDDKTEFEMEDWIQLFLKSLTVNDFMSAVPHFRMFERMLSITSKHITGSKLKGFFAEFISRMETLDVSVIPLFFEWCYVLYRQKLIFSRNQIREYIKYDVLKDSLLGLLSGKARNYIIALISCDLEISTKYLFPNSQISNWNEEFEVCCEKKYSLRVLQDYFWSFALQIFSSLADDNSIRESSFELKLRHESTCLCKIDDWIISNSNKSTQIEWFREKSGFLSNNKLLLILFSSFINFFPFTLEFFPITIELILNTKIEYCKSKIQSRSNLKNNYSDCSCNHNKISFSPLNEIYNLMIYLISSFIFIYYGIEYELLEEFNVIYEETFNILHYLTSNDKNNYSSFYKYSLSNHLLQIKELINHFGEHPSLVISVDELSYQIIDDYNHFVILVFNSILNIYKFRHTQSNLADYRGDNEIFEEILMTLLFLVILHPNTSDDVIIYLFNSIYEELYSFGFLLIGSCMTLLYKKDIFPKEISRRVQLNISNFRSIHLINSKNFPYIQFMNCTYNLISRNIENFRVINMIFQLMEGNYLQYIRNVPQITDSEKNQEENDLSINISLTLTSVYMKLLEFFHLNPSICKLFFEMKKCMQENGHMNSRLAEDSNFTVLSSNSKISLLEIFSQMSANELVSDSNNIRGETKVKPAQGFKIISHLHDLNIFKMNYTVMIHLLAILYVPIIKRTNMSLYKFKYSINPSSYLIGEDICFNNSEHEFNDKIYKIGQQGVSIPRQFCIEFLEEIAKYCKNLGKESPFDIDRFILKNPLDTLNINIYGQSITSLIHTCESDKNNKRCFVCCIDSYTEYLGIINSFQFIGEEKYKSYHFSKLWVNHAIIISIVKVINNSFSIDGINGENSSEITTIIGLSNKVESSFYNNLDLELLQELINMLIHEIKDDIIIIKESGDPQRILFRSLLINLLIIMLSNEIGQKILSSINFHNLLVRLCHLFSFRIECLATNIYNKIETEEPSELINPSDGFSTPIIRASHSRNVDFNDENNTPFSIASNKSYNTITPVSRRRITPIVISRSGSTNKRSVSRMDDQIYGNMNVAPSLALKEDTKSYSCIFHLKIILNAINIIKEIIPQKLNPFCSNNNEFVGKMCGVQNSDTEFILNIMENSLFFLLPSNTISKRSIVNYNNADYAELQNQDFNTLHESSESSEAEEIDNLSETYQSSKLKSTSYKIVRPTNIPFLLNDWDFSKDWYMEIVIYLIKFIFNNNLLIKDISSIITDIASRITLWNRKDNKVLIFNVCAEIFKFSHDYFHDELPEISLCLLRNSGFQLLQSIKFVFVAILDQNSLLIDNTLNELPSRNAKTELESLHRVIFVFSNLVRIFELCFQVLFYSGSAVRDKDDLWLRSAVNLIEMGVETLSTELLKMERIKLPPKVNEDTEFLDWDESLVDEYGNFDESKHISPNEAWNRNILECNTMLRECEYIHDLISSNWVDPNCSDQSNCIKKNKDCSNTKEIDDDLDNFITFEQCDEGILQENESYSDIKLTPHWNTFIKSLFL